jgi:hypothetical protein
MYYWIAKLYESKHISLVMKNWQNNFTQETKDALIKSSIFFEFWILEGGKK